MKDCRFKYNKTYPNVSGNYTLAKLTKIAAQTT